MNLGSAVEGWSKEIFGLSGMELEPWKHFGVEVTRTVSLA